MPIGSTSGARPKRLPSCQASASGRRFTGTIARISWPDGSSPCARSHAPIAPATEARSTSLTEPPSALPTAFTSASGIGSPQATRFAPLGFPFRRVGESSAISAIAATSLITLAPRRAPAIVLARPCCGSASASSARSIAASASAAALAERPPSGFSSASASESPPAPSRRDAVLGARSGGAAPPSVIDIITEMSAMPSPMQ